jgi:hypothetical protein
VEEITMKKPMTVADLLAIAVVCIEASEAQAQLLQSHSKGPLKKKEDREVNTIDWGDHKDRGYHGKQSLDQKEKRHFWHPDDAENWCEIQCSIGHDLQECNTFLDHRKMAPPAAPVPQEPRRVDQRRVDSDGDEQMGEINVIF